MKHTKKWLAMALALVLALALAVPVFAATETWATMSNGNSVLAPESAYTPASAQNALAIFQRYSDTWDAGRRTEALDIYYDEFKPAILGLEFKAHTFTDAPRGQWFDQALDYVCSTGKMNGVAPGVFDPQSSMTRAMAVTILWRINGEPAPKTAAGFSDVPAGQWYSAAIAWAVENKITNGTTATTFDPNGSVTREQMATFFSRMMLAVSGSSTTVPISDSAARAELNKHYSDASKISSYALGHVVMCYLSEVMKGNADGTFAPQANITRAQGAQMLRNYYLILLGNTFQERT